MGVAGPSVLLAVRAVGGIAREVAAVGPPHAPLNGVEQVVRAGERARRVKGRLVFRGAQFVVQPA